MKMIAETSDDRQAEGEADPVQQRPARGDRALPARQAVGPRAPAPRRHDAVRLARAHRSAGPCPGRSPRSRRAISPARGAGQVRPGRGAGHDGGRLFRPSAFNGARGASARFEAAGLDDVAQPRLQFAAAVGARRAERQAGGLGAVGDAGAGLGADGGVAAVGDAGGRAGGEIGLARVAFLEPGRGGEAPQQAEQDRLVDEIDDEAVAAGEGERAARRPRRPPRRPAPAGEPRRRRLRDAEPDQDDARPRQQRPPVEREGAAVPSPSQTSAGGLNAALGTRTARRRRERRRSTPPKAARRRTARRSGWRRICNAGCRTGSARWRRSHSSPPSPAPPRRRSARGV